MLASLPLLIGGNARAASAHFERINPVAGGVATRAAAATVADANAAADSAQAAFPAWSARGPNERRTLLLAAAEAMNARASDFVDAMMSEIGATQGWARFNLALAVSMIREAASLTTQIAGQVIPSDKPGCFSMALKEPAGVVLGIAPWNAPIIRRARHCHAARLW
jgi:acyl-CoA reductase-like NAD-dependent aldehyde dehydrogenase